MNRLLIRSACLAGFVLAAGYARADGPQVVTGSWEWPDQGLSVNPGGDFDEGALVLDLAIYDGRLAAAGAFLYAGGTPARSLALWDGFIWSTVGEGSPNSNVQTLFADSDALYIGGGFSSVAGVPAKRIAMWDGWTWSGFGTGLPWTVVSAIQKWDDGNGSDLFAGGDNIAKWNGLAWSVVGGGVSGGGGGVKALTLFDNGQGTALYAAGFFAAAGGVAVNKIARWDGQEWSALGQGITDPAGAAYALAVYDDGSGSALYMSGLFVEVDGVAAINIARWNGQSWSAVGDSGLQEYNEVTQLKVLDDGGGPALFAIGPDVLQKWDGKIWTRYMPRPGVMYTAQVFDGPNGPALHVGGGLAVSDEMGIDRHTNIARFERGFACGDFNGDGVVDQQDLGILLGSYDCDGPGCQGDADGDGDTDQADLGILLKFYGQKCG